MIGEAKDLVGVYRKYGKKTFKESVKTIKAHPDLLLESKPSLVAEVLAECELNMPKVNWKHVFRGELSDYGTATGFHHRGIYGKQIVEILEKPNKFGVYKAQCKINGAIKKKVFQIFFQMIGLG